MRIFLCLAFFLITQTSFGWGFYAHQRINYHAVFLLPPEMIRFYKQNIAFITEHAVDPDMRRYILPAEGARHYIDMDHYGSYPYDSLPRYWQDAVAKYTEDSLDQYGIVPWWIQTMLKRLTLAFQEKNSAHILKLSAEIGHYIADAHVPLHACSNHNGQFTNQTGIHGFWESRLPELLEREEWDLFIGKAIYLNAPLLFTWKRVFESALAADSVLRIEKSLSSSFPPGRKYAFEERNGKVIRQNSSGYAIAYNQLLEGMPERRMRQSIFAIASFWYTAWVDAGQPVLPPFTILFNEADTGEFSRLIEAWKNESINGRDH
jgi:hypothetical protein